MYNLYIKQKIFKITDHYDVFDENQNPVYHVNQDFKLIGNTVHVEKKDKTSSFVIDRQLFSLLPKYNVKFNDSK